VIPRSGLAVAARWLRAGGTIPGTVMAFDELGDQVAQIASRVLEIVERLDRQVFTDENNRKLGKLVDDITVLADGLRATIEPFREEETGKELAKLVRHVRRAANNVNGLVTDLRKNQGTVMNDVTGALKGIERLASETNDLVRSLRGELSGAGTSLSALMADLTEATNRLEETLTVIQADPSLLLRGGPNDSERP
jgi:ABC-type transporter Mla subunit MlaD